MHTLACLIASFSTTRPPQQHGAHKTRVYSSCGSTAQHLRAGNLQLVLPGDPNNAATTMICTRDQGDHWDSRMREGEIGALSQATGFTAYRIRNTVDPPVRVEGRLVCGITIILERGPHDVFTFDTPWAMAHRTLQFGPDLQPRTPIRKDVQLLEREDARGVTYEEGKGRDFKHGAVVVNGTPRTKEFRT